MKISNFNKVFLQEGFEPATDALCPKCNSHSTGKMVSGNDIKGRVEVRFRCYSCGCVYSVWYQVAAKEKRRSSFGSRFW